MSLDCCPLKLLGGDTWETLNYIEEYNAGHPPIAGGSLEQSKSFIDAVRFDRNEQNNWKIKLNINA